MDSAPHSPQTKDWEKVCSRHPAIREVLHDVATARRKWQTDQCKREVWRSFVPRLLLIDMTPIELRTANRELRALLPRCRHKGPCHAQ